VALALISLGDPNPQILRPNLRPGTHTEQAMTTNTHVSPAQRKAPGEWAHLILFPPRTQRALHTKKHKTCSYLGLIQEGAL
jgi:hypothetical protein